MRIKCRIMGLEDRIERLEKQAEQAICLHKLEHRIFGFDLHANYAESCCTCKKIIRTFDSEADWNKGRTKYMKARIKEFEVAIKQKEGKI